MPSNLTWLNHRFAGGWASDSGVNIVDPPQGQTMAVPFLLDAENVLFNLDGSVVKVPGATKLNSTVFESGAAIKGVFDYWNIGTAGNSAQHRIVHVGTTIKKDDGDGTFTDLFTGMTADAIPSYSVLEDVLVIASDKDTPKSWDGTTAQDLAGTPPNFSFVAMHQGRMWAAGDAANPSRLYYSALLDPEDWVGAGSGEINVDPRDGDEILGIFSHVNELFVFKGPNHGSIHRITGSAPTGGDAFARRIFARGVGTVAHNTIQRFGNDVYFLWADGSIRSLSATDRFGDLLLNTVSSAININYLNKNVKQSRLAHAQAAVDEIRGLYVVTLTAEGGATNNIVIVADLRFNQVRWSKLTVFSAESIASIIDPVSNSQLTIVFGGDDGFLYKWNNETKTHKTSSIPFKITLPFLNYGQNAVLKTMNTVGLNLSAPNSDSLTFGWTRDTGTQQTITATPAGGVKLGTFLLGTDVLRGGQFSSLYRYAEEGGDFRSVSYQITQNVNESDFGIHSFETQLGISGESAEDLLDT